MMLAFLLFVVDGNWSLWAEWSACSTTCGDGIRERTRTCTHPAASGGGLDCQGAPHESSSCSNSQLCSSKPLHSSYDQACKTGPTAQSGN